MSTDLTQTLLTELPLVLDGFDAWLGIAGDPNQSYPIVTYNLITSSNATGTGLASFSSGAESFRVQVTVFDDSSDCVRLIQTMADVDAAITDRGSYESVNFIRARALGGYGPTYIAQQRYFMMVRDFEIVLGKDTVEETP